MRWAFAAVVLLSVSPALADDFPGDAPKVHKTHRTCRTPQCHCNDTTSSTDCLDAKACADFCADHGGVAKVFKRPRHRGGKAPDAAEDRD